MANTLITKNSSTAAAIPTAGQLVQGELAVNVTDKRIFTEDSGGTVVELGINPSSVTTVSATITGGTINGTTVGATAAAAGAFTTLSASGTTTLSGNQIISVTDNTNAALRITQTGTGNAFVVEDSTSPDSSPFVIDATGRVLNGSTTSVSADDAGGAERTAWAFQANSTSVPSAGYLASYWADNTAGAGGLSLAKSRGAAVGTRAIVESGDELGQIGFVGDDGTNFISAAGIFAAVDGTPGTNDMPGRLVFSTTADGFSLPSERMRIDSVGRLLVNQTTVPAGAVPSPYGVGTAGNGGGYIQLLSSGGIGLNQWAANAQGNGIGFNKSRTATPNSGTVTNSGDNLGYLLFNADDGANFIRAAQITGVADGASSTNSAPGRLVFSTTAAGSATPSERVRIDSAGYLIVPNGITLGTSVGTYAAENTLDDYEEGTWDPIYDPASGAFTSVTYDIQTGHYTKVGRLVTCTFLVRTDAITVGTASGAIKIGALPFTSISSAARILSISYANLFAGETPAAGYASGAGNTMTLNYRTTADGNFNNSLQVSDLGTGANANYIIGSVIYYAD